VGIGIYGAEGLSGLRIYPTATDYANDTNVLVYLGTDGKLRLTGGSTLRWYNGEDYIGCIGVGDAGELVITSQNSNDIILESDKDIILKAFSSNVLPVQDNYTKLGLVSKQFYGGYFKSRLKIPVGTDMYD